MDRAPSARQPAARASRLAPACILIFAWVSFAPAGPCLGGPCAGRDRLGTRILELEPIEPAAPSQSLDDAVRVVLVSEPVRSPEECGAGQGIWSGPAAPVLIDGSMTRRNETVTVELVTPLRLTAERYLRRLFPRLQVVPARPPAPSFDLLLRVAATSYFTGGKGADHEVTVTVSASAEANFHHQVGQARGVGHASQPSNLPWSPDTAGLALVRSAFAQAQSQMFTNFFYDPKLRDYLRAQAAQRAQPPSLETTGHFVERGALPPNGRLDPGEMARIELRVTNHGPGLAQDVKVLLGPGRRGVSIPAQTPVGDLAARDSKDVSIPIGGDPSLDAGPIELNVRTVEKRGYEGRPLTLRFDAADLAHPGLEISMVKLQEAKGSHLGARDEQPVIGERIDCVVRVRNAGAAPVKGAGLTLAAPHDGVRVLKDWDHLPTIPALAEAEGHLEVLVPATFTGHDLTMTFVVNDSQRSRVVKKTMTWPVHLEPLVKLQASIYGVPSLQPQGLTRVQVLLIATNFSSLTARRASLRLRPQPGVRITPQELELGDLAGGYAQRQVRLALEFPSSFNQGIFASHVVLDVTFSQDGFSPRQDLISLPPVAESFPPRLAGASPPMSVPTPSAPTTAPAVDPGALCCQVTKAGFAAFDDATLERCGYTRSGQRRTVRYSTSMQVQQVRVVGSALWIEVTSGAHPDPLAEAVAAGTLRLVDDNTHRPLPGLTLGQNHVGKHKRCRVLLTTAPPPRVGQRLTLTVPPEALRDAFFHQPAAPYSLTFTWPPADRVLEELAAPVLHRVSVRDYKLVIELSLEPDLASARSAVLIDGRPLTWRLGEDHYTLRSMDDVPTGHHSLTIGTGLASIGGHHLAAAASYSLDMDDEDANALVCDAGWEP